jgi:hypothetical protein
MNSFFDELKAHIKANPPNHGDGDSVLTLLYETYSELNRLDNDAIRAGLDELYELMNGMELREMDKIIYPVCQLCRDHEHAGFVEGIKIGILLQAELTEN